MRVVAAAAADREAEKRGTRMSKLEVKLGERGEGETGGLLEEQRYLRRDEEEVGCG